MSTDDPDEEKIEIGSVEKPMNETTPGATTVRHGDDPALEDDPALGLEFHEEEVIDKPFDRTLAKRLFRYVLPYKRQLTVSFGLILVSALLGIAGPIVVKQAIDGPLRPGGGDISPIFAYVGSLFGLDASLSDESVRLRWLGLVVLIHAIVLGLRFGISYVQQLVMNVTGQNVMRDLRLQLFGHLQRQGAGYFHKNPVGRLLTRTTSDVESLNELFTSGIVVLIGDVLTIVGIVTAMFIFNWQLALVALGVTPFLFLFTSLFRRMARKYYREIRRRLSYMNSYTQETITGIGVIQISRRERRRLRGYQQIADGFIDAYMGSIFWYAVFFPSLELLSAAAIASVAMVSVEPMAYGTMTIGEFFLFWMYLTKVFEPVRDLAEKYNVLQAAMAAGERIFGVLDHDASLPLVDEPKDTKDLLGTIRFENVSFRYNDDEPVLEEVSFEIPKGHMIAIVGATGAGKSTVINLLLRFYDPTSGRITIDGVDIRDVDLQEHRKRFGLVLQDVSVFSRTIRENIDLDRGLSDERLERAAKEVNAHTFIEKLPRGFDEPMRERGSSLSSGERQLLSFARALAGEPDVLVLDEATSHIDSETEALVQEALSRLVRGRTSVVIAHRLSTIRSANTILVFHHGRLRESGRHDELVVGDGIYAKLHRLQFAGM